METHRTKFGKCTSLKHNSIITFIMSFIFPSFLLVVILFGLFINEEQKSQERECQNTLRILSSHLVNNIDLNSSLSLSYLFDDNITSFCNFLNQNNYDELFSFENYDSLLSFNKRTLNYTATLNRRMTILGDSILGIGFIPYSINTNKLFYLKKYGNIEMIGSVDYFDTQWYELLSTNTKNLIFIPSPIDTDSQTISLIRVMKDVDKQHTIGYIFLDISLDFILESANYISIDPNSGILLKSPDGHLLFSTSESLNRFDFQLTGSKTKRDLIDKYKTYAFTDDSYGFTFYYLSSNCVLLRKAKIALFIVFGFYMAMILIEAYLWNLNSKQMQHSISSILTTMNRYNAGDVEVLTDLSSCTITEFQTIAKNLNSMIIKTNNHINNEYKFRIAQKEAEYKTLQSEINPHFLYNTLNLLIGLNRMGDDKKLEKSIISLSHMFRYICDHTYESTIKKEFDFIEDYLYLQQIRFEERLNFTITLSDDIKGFEIPKLLIQPLVENAIIHGLEPSENPEFIHLDAFVAKTQNKKVFIVISVINSGHPYIKDTAKQNIGIKNIEDRLSIISPDSFLSLQGGPGMNTKCIILLPYESS